MRVDFVTNRLLFKKNAEGYQGIHVSFTDDPNPYHHIKPLNIIPCPDQEKTEKTARNYAYTHGYPFINWGRPRTYPLQNE